MRLLPIFALIFALFAGTVFAEDRAREIVVSGEGIVRAAPDMATIRIGVSREARLASEAKRLTSEAMAAVLAQLDAAGIAPRDVQTANISLSPRYQRTNDGRPPRVTGYVAQNDLMVRVRDLAALGGALDAVISEGVNAMNGIFIAVADPGPLEVEARRAAVADARGKAEVLADAAGVTLGAVVSIQEGGVRPVPSPVMRSMAMESSAVPIAAGEIDVRSQVTMVFEIGE